MKKLIMALLAASLGLASISAAYAENNCGGSGTNFYIYNKSGQDIYVYSSNWGNGVASNATTPNSQLFIPNGQMLKIGPSSKNCANGSDKACTVIVDHILFAGTPTAQTCSLYVKAQYWNLSNSGWMGGDKRCTGKVIFTNGPVQMDSNKNPIGLTCGACAGGSYEPLTTATGTILDILPPGSGQTSTGCTMPDV